MVAFVRQSFPDDLLRLSPRATRTGDPSDSLAGVNTTKLADGAECFVRNNRRNYVLNKTSSAAPDGLTVVQPEAGPGRWLLDTTGSSSSTGLPLLLSGGLGPEAPLIGTGGASQMWIMPVNAAVFSRHYFDGPSPSALTALLGWAPSSSEASKTVSWRLEVGRIATGEALESVAATVDVTNEAVPATAGTYTSSEFIIPEAALTGALGVTLKVSRLSSGSDPDDPPAIALLRLI